jgi:hypothetical protein
MDYHPTISTPAVTPVHSSTPEPTKEKTKKRKRVEDKSKSDEPLNKEKRAECPGCGFPGELHSDGKCYRCNFMAMLCAERGCPKAACKEIENWIL